MFVDTAYIATVERTARELGIYLYRLEPAYKSPTCTYFSIGAPHGHPKRTRAGGACWHLHRDLFSSLFSAGVPRVCTRVTEQHPFVWYTQDNFHDVYERTGETIGSSTKIPLRKECYCEMRMAHSES